MHVTLHGDQSVKALTTQSVAHCTEPSWLLVVVVVVVVTCCCCCCCCCCCTCLDTIRSTLHRTVACRRRSRLRRAPANI